MAVVEMCDSDDVDDHQGYGDGVSYVVGIDGDFQGDGLGVLRPLLRVYLVVLPHRSDAHLHLRPEVMLLSNGFPKESRRASESVTPPRHKTGMNRDAEENEESTRVGFLYAAVVFLELRDEATYIVNCVGFVHHADVLLELRDDGRMRFVSKSEVGFRDGHAGGEKLRHVRLLWEREVGFRDGDAGEELPISAAGHHGDEDWVHDVPVPSEFSWEHVMGSPLPQTVPDTCALVAATVCLEAQHRLRFEKKYGRGTFPCRAAAPRKLRAACFRDLYWCSFTGKLRRTWAPGQGANAGRVLTKLKQLGGARTTNAPTPAPFFLPLADWCCYSYNNELTQQTAARLIFERGPCIGTLFSIPGCRREDRETLIKEDPGRFGMHAVVCYAYRYTKKGEKLKINVLDNEWPLGTTRWVAFEEFDRFYLLDVYPLPPRHLLGRSPPLEYPLSSFM